MNYTAFVRNSKIDVVDTRSVFKDNFKLAEEIFGLGGETGEVLEYFKKHVLYGRPFSREHLMSELGDVIHYCVAIGIHFDMTLEEITEYNRDKIRKRQNA